jgi:DNA-binding transcriptional LysR family regulator
VGLAILPQAICSDDVRQGKLVRVLADTWQIPPLIAAATYLERRYVPLCIRALIEAMAAEFNSRPTGQLRPGE